jgi:hypothetical protein
MKHFVRVCRPRFELAVLEIEAEDDDEAEAIAYKQAASLPDDAWHVQAFAPEHYHPHVETCHSEDTIDANVGDDEDEKVDYVERLKDFDGDDDDTRYLLLLADIGSGEGRVIFEPWFCTRQPELLESDLCGDWVSNLEEVGDAGFENFEAFAETEALRAADPERWTNATARMEQAVLTQREAFRKKFGRDPGPDDPIYFDPRADEPKPMDASDLEDNVLAAMNEANLPLEFAYAYRKTGLLGLGRDKSLWPPEHVKEWNAAVDEYRAMQAAQDMGDRPNPEQWSTAIPELLIMPFTQESLNQVLECMEAVAPIQSQGMTVATRIELASAFVGSACSQAYDAGEAMGEEGAAETLFDKALEIIIARARELYVQGRV